MSSDVPQYCPCCKISKENFEKKYFPGENETYVVCSACLNLIASSTIPDKENHPISDVSDICNGFDEGVFSGQNEDVVDISDVDCEIYRADSGQARPTQSLPLSVNNRQRLQNSCSVFEFVEKPNVADADIHSATLDNGELSRDSLKQARQVYCQNLSCTNCASSQILPVEGVRDVYYCSGCFSISGVDDTMNFYDLLQKGDYEVEACVNCGNTNPNLFLLELGINEDSVNLRCINCSHAAQVNESESMGNEEMPDEENALKEWIHYECKCKNHNSELHKFSIDSSSNTVFVKCWGCEQEDMIALNEFKPKICTCDNSESIVMFDEFGYASLLVCPQCRAEMQCGASTDADISAAGDGTSTGRTRILSVSDIQIGDHIAWQQILGYWHHAIVSAVDGGQIRIINYDGPSAHKATVVEEWMQADVTGELYRINYKPSDYSHPKVVIERARSRLGQGQYNLLTNNCEHFARWCKTGHKRSMQSESFFRSMSSRAFTMLQSSIVSGSKFLFSPPGQAVLKHGGNVLNNAAKSDAVKVAAGQAMSNEVAPILPAVATCLTPALIISREIQMVCRDIRDAQQQRRDGNITRQEFIKITVKRVTEGCCSVAGVGVALAIPVGGNSIGCTLGAVIGHGAGVVAGRGICRLLPSKSTH